MSVVYLAEGERWDLHALFKPKSFRDKRNIKGRENISSCPVIAAGFNNEPEKTTTEL